MAEVFFWPALVAYGELAYVLIIATKLQRLQREVALLLERLREHDG